MTRLRENPNPTDLTGIPASIYQVCHHKNMKQEATLSLNMELPDEYVPSEMTVELMNPIVIIDSQRLSTVEVCEVRSLSTTLGDDDPSRHGIDVTFTAMRVVTGTKGALAERLTKRLIQKMHTFGDGSSVKVKVTSNFFHWQHKMHVTSVIQQEDGWEYELVGETRQAH